MLDFVLTISPFLYFSLIILEDELRNKVIDAGYNKRIENFKLCPEPNASCTAAIHVGTSTDYRRARSDDVVQEVNTTFDFQNDGTIVGSGFDSVDGKYIVEGNWKLSPKGSKYFFLWKETYSSYSVTVVGKMLQEPTKESEAGTIFGRFCSSHDHPAKGSLKIQLDLDFWR